MFLIFTQSPYTPLAGFTVYGGVPAVADTVGFVVDAYESAKTPASSFICVVT